MEKKILEAIQKSATNYERDFAALLAHSREAGVSIAERQGLVKDWQQNHRSILESLSEDVTGVVREKRAAQSKRLLLHSLDFPQLKERRQAIAKAHVKTFSWIFDRNDAAEESHWSNFVEWAIQDSDQNHLYWVTGKPGSGKSTLMRYLYEEKRTKTLLRHWAKDQKLVMASCFFWNPGLRMQKSFEGLMRSLIHEILIQCPELIQAAAPWRWQWYELGVAHLASWTNSELFDCLKRLIVESQSSIKIAFFVDGLDEFEGDDTARTEIIDLFRDIASNPNVKVCVSSRPWLIFKDAFQGQPSLLLQELTHNDIRDYVQAELGEHPKFKKLETKDESSCQQLVLDITTKADGVFLWVYLVVRSLRQGLSKEDGIRDLKRRLDHTPADLESYFAQLMSTLEPFYLEQAMQLFSVALTAARNYGGRALSLLTYSYILDEDPMYALQSDLRPIHETEAFERYERASRRVDNLCKGLLEVRNLPSDKKWKKVRMVPYPYVHFLHRTVIDFMLSPDMSKEMGKHLDESFDANLIACNAHLAQIKGVVMDRDSGDQTKSFNMPLFELLATFLASARASEAMGKSLTASIDEMHAAVSLILLRQNGSSANFFYSGKLWINDTRGHMKSTEHFSSQKSFTAFGDYDHEKKTDFLRFALTAGLPLYVMEKLKGEVSLVKRKPGRSLLDTALYPEFDEACYDDPDRDIMVRPRRPYFDVVNLLLRLGADSSEKFKGQEACVRFITLLRAYNLAPNNSSEFVPWAETARLIIIDSHKRSFERYSEVLEQLRMVISAKFPPEMVDDLLELLDGSPHAIKKRGYSRMMFKRLLRGAFLWY